MTDKIDKQIKKNHWENTVIVAVSGGVDSVVLLYALRETLPKLHIIIAHVNYHLRSESDDDARFVAQLADKFNATFEQIEWLDIPQKSVEKKAREFRYQFFSDLAKKYSTHTIIVAHHADDQAETVLLKLVRGGQLSQLSGMDGSNQNIFRPFLGITKQEIITYAQKKGLSWREDRTNNDPSYTPRNLLRNEIIPNLKTINRQVVYHINDFAKQIAEQERLIKSQASQYAEAFEKNWTSVPELWLVVTIKVYLQQKGLYQFKESQIKQIHLLLLNNKKTTGFVQLSKTLMFVKSYQQVYLTNTSEITNTMQVLPTVMLKLNQWQKFADEAFKWTDNDSDLNVEKLPFSMITNEPFVYLRPAKASDKLAIINGHKKLRRLAIDEKLSQAERQKMVVLSTPNDEIIAVKVRQHWRISTNFVTKQDAKLYWLAWRIEER